MGGASLLLTAAMALASQPLAWPPGAEDRAPFASVEATYAHQTTDVAGTRFARGAEERSGASLGLARLQGSGPHFALHLEPFGGNLGALATFGIFGLGDDSRAPPAGASYERGPNGALTFEAAIGPEAQVLLGERLLLRGSLALGRRWLRLTPRGAPAETDGEASSWCLVSRVDLDFFLWKEIGWSRARRGHRWYFGGAGTGVGLFLAGEVASATGDAFLVGVKVPLASLSLW